jgi:hypothetical protein
MARSDLDLAVRRELMGNTALWIAAYARSLDLILVANNEHEFQRVEGLAVENWAGREFRGWPCLRPRSQRSPTWALRAYAVVSACGTTALAQAGGSLSFQATTARHG